jgi:septin family protein
MITLGSTNVGKSTFLNNLLGMKNFFNNSELRETAAFWTLKPIDSVPPLFSFTAKEK